MPSSSISTASPTQLPRRSHLGPLALLLASCTAGPVSTEDSSRQELALRATAAPAKVSEPSAEIRWSLDFGTTLELPAIWLQKKSNEGRMIGTPEMRRDPATGGVYFANATVIYDQPVHRLALERSTLSALLAGASHVDGRAERPVGSLALRIASDGTIQSYEHVVGTEAEPAGDIVPMTGEWKVQDASHFEVQLTRRPSRGLPSTRSWRDYESGYLLVREIEPGLALLKLEPTRDGRASERHIVGNIDAQGVLEIWIQ
ncbi:MAG: hypothetical protein IPN34_19255 [Planctomycetes bacterium]|nr:hypothetical protein [Planctomycetota bacterium]